MHTNIRGLVNSLELYQAQGMMPLYEAFSNAIDAITESGLGLLNGRIDVRLLRQRDLGSDGRIGSALIDGFSIEDNGVGFNQSNFAAFKEAYTQVKVRIGGKGVGRFTYLKVFSAVDVESTFGQPTERKKRTFKFSVDNEVHGESEPEEVPALAKTGTRVTLANMHASYRPGWPVESELIAQRIVTHFLIRFAARSCPPCWLYDDGHSAIDLQQLFTENILPHIEEFTVSVGDHEFNVQVFRNQGSKDGHKIIFCATGREVMPTKLRTLLPELPERFTSIDADAKPYTLQVLVTGEYLDRNANSERTEIIFDKDDLGSDGTRIKRAALEDAVASGLRKRLANDLKETNEEKLREINQFIEKAPEYRVLLNDRYRDLIQQKVPAGCNEKQLDSHLLGLRREIEDQVRDEGNRIKALVDEVSFDEYKEKMRTFIETINDVGKSQLASYVAHRRAILDLLSLSLKKTREDEKYRLEEVLHNMIFPMGQNSHDVFIDQQNLWVLDERLSFHTILTSDKKLNSITGLENTSGKEPDIFAFFYDTPIGLQELSDRSGAIVVIEFKRPGRDDYSSDPAQQVIQRFVEINAGNVKDIDGRPINPLNLRYFGYLIADLTPTLKRQMEMNYHISVDGEGYFKTLTGGNGYVEIVSYEKLLKDANQRNRVLFDKLGLHKH